MRATGTGTRGTTRCAPTSSRTRSGLRHPKDVSDEEILAAEIFHDILEDSDFIFEDLIPEFNRPIADLVMELTHEEGGNYFPRLESKKAVLVKFADRLSNLSRMGDWSGYRQPRYPEISKFWPRGPPGDTIGSTNVVEEARAPPTR